MYKFSEVDYDADAGTATIGAGLIWDDVYAALAPYNVNVVGGRVTGVGVAGFSLGGGKCHAACGAGIRALCRRRGAEVVHSCVPSSGFSWKTNQHGLTIDTIVGYELVMPNGTITSVTADSDPDLFWGLKVRNPSVTCLYSSESPD